MLVDIFDFLCPAEEKYCRKQKSYSVDSTGYGWPPDYEYCYQKLIINPITNHPGFIIAQGEINNISGKHLHALLDTDADWVSFNHDGIKGIPKGQPGMERMHVLFNGDLRGMILSPRVLNIDAVIEVRDMPWRPYADMYKFCYSQIWEAHEYAKEADCSNLTRLPGNWMPVQKVRTVYTYNFGGEIGQRRILEFWSGNDLLWEIGVFVEGMGFTAYRQWSIQGNGIFPPQTGRTIVWTIPGVPETKVDCCFGGPFIV